MLRAKSSCILQGTCIKTKEKGPNDVKKNATKELQSYILHQNLHPILHPKSSVNTKGFDAGCRKCRRFSKTFFQDSFQRWICTYNPQNTMFRIFKTKHNFSQNEAYTKHKIQKCSSLNARLSFSCQSIRFLVKEVSVSSAYFCYKFVVCLIFLHFFQKIWLLMNLYIPLQRGSCNHWKQPAKLQNLRRQKCRLL